MFSTSLIEKKTLTRKETCNILLQRNLAFSPADLLAVVGCAAGEEGAALEAEKQQQEKKRKNKEATLKKLRARKKLREAPASFSHLEFKDAHGEHLERRSDGSSVLGDAGNPASRKRAETEEDPPSLPAKKNKVGISSASMLGGVPYPREAALARRAARPTSNYRASSPGAA